MTLTLRIHTASPWLMSLLPRVGFKLKRYNTKVVDITAAPAEKDHNGVG